MSFLNPPKPFLETGSWNRAQANALRYNTSQAGSVIPLIYGTTRQQVQLIGFGNYRGPSGKKGKNGPLPVQGAHVGKGGGSSGKKGPTGKKSQNYSVDVDFCICQGPVTIGDHNWVWSSAGVEYFVSASGQGLHLYTGADGQAADSTFVGLGQVVGYSGTCHIAGTPLDLGQSPAIPNLSFEVNGFENGTNTGAQLPNDANPAEVINDFLTNSRYGAGFPSANIDPDMTNTGVASSYVTYCQATELCISVALQVQTEAAAWVSEIARLTNTAIVWSGNILKFIPYGDIAINSNGTTFTPDLTVQYSLNDDHFLPWKPHLDTSEPELGDDDPVIVERTNPADAINWVSIEYWDRSNFYNNTLVAQFDQGSIDAYGLRTESAIQGNCFTNATTASLSARLILQRKLYIRNIYRFQLGWQFALLEPMDIVEITDSRLGLTNQPVRIISIEENDNGDLTVEAEEITNATVIAPAPPASALGAAVLGGGTWLGSSGGPLTGSTDSPLGSFSLWWSPYTPTVVAPATVRGFFRTWSSVGGSEAYIALNYDETNGRIQLFSSGAAWASDHLNAQTILTNLLPTDGRWHHIACSWNTSSFLLNPGDPIPTSVIQLYMDGNPILMEAVQVAGTGFTIPYATMPSGATEGWKIWTGDGALPSGEDFHGMCQDFWLKQGVQLDFSGSDIQKFRTPGGLAQLLGNNGEAPLGSPPDIFFHADPTVAAGSHLNFATNLGTGGPIGGWPTTYPSLAPTNPYQGP